MLCFQLLALADSFCGTQSAAIGVYKLVPGHADAARRRFQGRGLLSQELGKRRTTSNFQLLSTLGLTSRSVWSGFAVAKVIGALAVDTGDKIADVGSGAGFFSLPQSIAVGVLGKIYAVDTQAEMLAWIIVKWEQAAFAEAGQYSWLVRGKKVQ
jgi:hypothetical protein